MSVKENRCRRHYCICAARRHRLRGRFSTLCPPRRRQATQNPPHDHFFLGRFPARGRDWTGTRHCEHVGGRYSKERLRRRSKPTSPGNQGFSQPQQKHKSGRHPSWTKAGYQPPGLVGTLAFCQPQAAGRSVCAAAILGGQTATRCTRKHRGWRSGLRVTARACLAEIETESRLFETSYRVAYT